MKLNNLKFILSLVLCLLLSSFLSINTSVTYAKDNEIYNLGLGELSIYSDNVTKGNVDNYLIEIKNQIPLFKDIIKSYSNDNFELGNEISIYNLDTKEKVFYYPIYLDNECVLMASQTESSGITVTNDLRVYNKLIKDNINESVCLPYIYNNKLYSENQTEKVLLVDYTKENGEVQKKDNSYENLSFNEKVKFIENEFSCKLNESNYIRETTGLNTSSSLYSTNEIASISYTSNSVTNIMEAAVVQQYDNCWAAATATIINHRNGTSALARRYSAEEICDAMGISYNAGGSAVDIYNALQLYSINYSLSGAKIAYSTVKSRIDSNKPFAMQLLNSQLTGGHSVVAIGYMYSLTDNFVLFYDPNGYYTSFNYSSPKYTVNNVSLTWQATVY